MAQTEKNSSGKTAAEAIVLNRYTSLPIALDILYEKRLTLLSPDTWEDRNDAHYLERYRDENDLNSVLAICFSLGNETYHPWRVFSSGSSGVCIEFDKDKLLPSFPAKKGFKHKQVHYHSIKGLQKKSPKSNLWPFLKRIAFKDEKEYRITFESTTEDLRAKSISIDLTSIRKVRLSPWLPEEVAGSIISVIKKIHGCAQLNVIRSSLIDNARWRKLID